MAVFWYILMPTSGQNPVYRTKGSDHGRSFRKRLISVVELRLGIGLIAKAEMSVKEKKTGRALSSTCRFARNMFSNGFSFEYPAGFLTFLILNK